MLGSLELELPRKFARRTEARGSGLESGLGVELGWLGRPLGVGSLASGRTALARVRPVSQHK